MNLSTSSFVSNKNVLVIGLGKSGVSATKFLHKHKAKVTVSDILIETQLKDVLPQIKGMYVASEFGRHNIKDFANYDYVIVSPGIRDERIVKLLEKHADKVMTEVELGLRHYPHRVVAITGTNGKTTTGTIAKEILTQMSIPCFFAGNNGNPLCEYLLDHPKKIEETAVIELSSFMLQWAKDIHPKIGAVVNISPHHLLDHAKSFENYMSAKTKLALALDEDGLLVFNALDTSLSRFKSANKGQMAYFSKRPLTKQIKDNPSLRLVHWVEKNILHIHFGKPGKHLVLNIKAFPLLGYHNIDNLMAALQIAMSVDQRAFIHSLNTLDLSKIKAPAYRLQKIHTKDKVNAYNDAKSTNLMSTIRAIESLPAPIILICGGKETFEDFHPLIPYIKKKVKTTLLIGQTKERLNRILGEYSETFLVGSLEEAVLLAYQKSHLGDTILFSPGFPSYDMFKNFEERGLQFNTAIQKI
jgi:UDP-N-acetylmuramoylalanine--D-glutamate ligase